LTCYIVAAKEEESAPWGNSEYMYNMLVPLRDTNLEPTPPGVIIKTALQAKRMSFEDFAASCKIPLPALEDIVNGKTRVDDSMLKIMYPVLGAREISLIFSARYKSEYYTLHNSRPRFVPEIPKSAIQNL
jgi:hypothetical protein